VDVDGQVWCWGANGEGQVTGTASTVQNVARRLDLPAEMGRVRSVEVAAGVSCAVAEAPEGDDVWCWGDDGDLLGGLPSGVSRWAPPDSARPLSIRALSLSSARWTTDPNDGDWGVHALVMTWDGRVLCWGDRRGGPCDDTSPTDETVVELDWGAW
jgi:alpha-tubulin suppressor-like RCC1 family protein